MNLQRFLKNPIWTPDASCGTTMKEFMNFCGGKYNIQFSEYTFWKCFQTVDFKNFQIRISLLALFNLSANICEFNGLVTMKLIAFDRKSFNLDHGILRVVLI